MDKLTVEQAKVAIADVLESLIGSEYAKQRATDEVIAILSRLDVIAPRFKVGQEVWRLILDFAENRIAVRRDVISEVVTNLRESGPRETPYGRFYGECFSDTTFATRAEAEAEAARRNGEGR